MAKKGENKKQKRLSAPKTLKIKRKGIVWITKTKAGAHKREESVPLAYVISILGLANNRKEIKSIIKNGKVKVNGIIRKELGFPVGLFDILELSDDKNRTYRLLYDKKGRLIPYEKKDIKNMLKISKVKDKRIIKGAKVQITTEDGLVFVGLGREVNVNDSLLVRFPEKEVLDVIEMKKGNLGYIKSGKNVGEVAIIKEVLKGTAKREGLIILESKNDETISTTISKLIPIGKKEPAIDVEV
ncbi:MAG: S4 domain-containing protein [Candidatus Diapherotrites archaeon]|nr:S4 domain-containing protein [Candidatus Diapherotrites archaeon]